VSNESLYSDVNNLRKGDCVVAFSRKKIFQMKQMIESVTRKKCAVIYGSLPMESRTHQAQLFNDPNTEFDILVATDAVGMGLNLNIGRIVFETFMKYDGDRVAPIPYELIKQIGGRAGRFNSIYSNGGQVTTLDQRDMHRLRKAFYAPTFDYPVSIP
jgi:ATP-dependent RNA helicase SUPV3L1/SUV3